MFVKKICNIFLLRCPFGKTRIDVGTRVKNNVIAVKKYRIAESRAEGISNALLFFRLRLDFRGSEHLLQITNSLELSRIDCVHKNYTRVTMVVSHK